MSDLGVSVDSRRIYDGEVISLRVDRFQLPGGQVFEREVVEHLGDVVMLPFLDDGSLSPIRRYRHLVCKPEVDGSMGLELKPGTILEIRLKKIEKIRRHPESESLTL